MDDNKENSTFRLDKEIKKDFKIECAINGNDMSEAVESLMTNYINLSRKMRTQS